MTPLETALKTQYETDYLKWIETTLEKLRSRDYDSVDWENLIEEIEDMGRSEQRSLKSNLIVVLVHLLKWQFQPDRRSGSWGGSIVEHRRRIQEAVDDSPSLRPYLESIFDGCYLQAVKQAKAETGLSSETFPQQCPYELVEVMSDEFLPH
ncbi:DUF29 domain-containing protein [Phormidesmis priestleyi ULC007]|uniref:DUF29 domain-containing protein n=1 Tax=Phormidesmis priestleyi ULC007 TaxID=1920490 RepID=A0A2T1DEU0_9CYAN|nr:DUF29 domain-containing protein [Phormidesmis priestleyi]PSB18987.1 DUF29 domain-containing protein [Phormidesmis priestleyi ULC007]PZO53975.1 MAG: DUF29 domain-containing protein [Phormidesmis priestleyi]